MLKLSPFTCSMRSQISQEWPRGHVCDLLLTELLPLGQRLQPHPPRATAPHSAGLPCPVTHATLEASHHLHAFPSTPLTLMVSSSMRRRLFSDRRSLFLVSICCSCVSNSASYSRLPSWNSRSSSCVFSALRQNSRMSENNLLSTYTLLHVIHGSALYSTIF